LPQIRSGQWDFSRKTRTQVRGESTGELAKLDDMGERRYVSTKNDSTEQDGAMKPLARRKFVSLAAHCLARGSPH